MKLNTHDRTPRPKNSKLINALLAACYILMLGSFGLASFACFYYAQSVAGGITVILIPVLLTAVLGVSIKDMEKAYVEITESGFCVADYYLGIKKEKYFAYSDITSAEIHRGYSLKVKGYRFGSAVMSYIVFKKDNKYLFKIIALPETMELFKQYIQ